ncbi:hypothetical protein COMNV_01779 [Commensalibacter sp. Nvir]|nr:hypothetical protein COMNV_01779 [Commensalibacter sp. Nvir]
MLGGVRTPYQVQAEMAEDIMYWGSHRIGLYTIRKKSLATVGSFLGVTGIHLRPDGKGYALRFALWPWARGNGYAHEAAFAVLTEAHKRGYRRIIAMAREDNIASRRVLGGIGMIVESFFLRKGNKIFVYASEQT